MNEEAFKILGKTYISSRRASEEFGYTIDYIGQLARAGKIESKMISRTRFVSRESLKNYRHSNGLPEKKFSIDPRLAPVIGALAVFLLVILYALPKTLELASGIVGADLETASVGGVELAAGSVFGVVEASQALDQKLFAFLDLIERRLIVLGQNLREKLALFWGGARKILVGEQETTEIRIAERPADGENILVPASGLSEQEIKRLVEQLVEEEIESRGGAAAPVAGPQQGIAVIPASGESLRDEEIKERVRQAFSDEVVVSLDESRSAGVVRPVFRGPTDQSYMFVLVPIQ